jgi:hypothetical protein
MPTCNFVDATFSRVFDALVRWDPAVTPPAPAGYLGNPAVSHPIVGAPFKIGNTPANFFRIVRDDTKEVVAETNLFTVMGKTLGALSTSSPSLDFGIVTVGQASAPQSVTLTNNGTTSVTIGTITPTGDFAVAAGSTCPGATVAPSATCTVSVTMTPAAPGTRPGSLEITSTGGPALMIGLTGFGEPGLSMLPNPVRLLETRASEGQTGYFGPKPAAGQIIELKVAGAPGGAPADASAVVMTVTATNTDGSGFVTVWPCGQPKPKASNLNFTAGQTVANLVVSKVGVNGRVCLFGLASTDLVADLAGYVGQGSLMKTLDNPERLLETRVAEGQIGYSGGKPVAGDVIRLQVTGKANITSGTESVALNITGTEAPSAGFITVWPCDQPRPNASNLNLDAGSTAPNLVIAKLAGDGSVCLFTQSGAHLIADATAYLVPGAPLVATQPARILETRASEGLVGYSGGKPAAGATVTLRVADRAGVPAGVQAVMFNLTGIEADNAGFVTVWPCTEPQPKTSNLNLATGGTRPTLVLARVDSNGDVCIFTSGGAHLAADVLGYRRA